MLYADADIQLILYKSQDDLQSALYSLQQIMKNCNMTISVNKMKIMAFKEKWLWLIVMEQVTNFQNFGCGISFCYDKDEEKKSIHSFKLYW